MNHCGFRKPNGEPCQATAQRGRAFCVFHDPERAAEMQRARREGGINRTRTAIVLPPQTPDALLESQMDIAGLLSETINQVRRGELDVRTANTIGFLANTLSRVLEQGKTEERLARVEALLGIPTDGDPTDLKKGGVIYANTKPKTAN